MEKRKATRSPKKAAEISGLGPMDYDWKAAAIVFVLALIALLVVRYVLVLPLDYALLLYVLILVVTGELMITAARFNRIFFASYLIQTKRWLPLIYAIGRKNQTFWRAFADWGLVVGFGLFSLLIFRKNISKKVLLLGLVTNLILGYYISVYDCNAVMILNIPQITSRLDCSLAASAQNINLLVSGIAVVGGWLGFVLINLLLAAADNLYLNLAFLRSVALSSPNYSLLQQEIPGVTPVIPGLTLPIFAGIAALVVVLTSHEFSHGILARLKDIKLKSMGIILAFGLIPFGAFVEPEEKQVSRLNEIDQTRIFIAGVSMNFVFAIVFLIIFAAFTALVLPSFVRNVVVIAGSLPNSPANVLPVGSVIVSWDGHYLNNTNVSAIAALESPNATYSIATTNGTYSVRSNSTGKIGVYASMEGIFIKNNLFSTFVYGVYEFIGLTFLLSFLVGALNLLPLPGLDGWRIFSSNTKRRKAIFVIGLIVIATFYLNVLPWSWNFPLLGIPAVLIATWLAFIALRWLWRWTKEKK